MQKIKILQLCNKPPYPPLDGGAIGMNNVSNEFIEAGFDTKIVAINTPKHSVTANELDANYLEKFKVEFAFINTNTNIIKAFKSILSSSSYNIDRFNSNSLHENLIKILSKNTFDIIQIESIFLHNYVETIRKYSKAKIILRAPNIEHIIWERRTNQASTLFKKLYFKQLTKSLRKEELEAFKKFDAIYTVTQYDQNFILANGFKGKTTFIPTGLDVTKSLNHAYSRCKLSNIFFIGALDWSPNIEGLFWFINNVLPLVYDKIPDLKFHIAGRNTPKSIHKLASNSIIVHGEVDNAQEFISTHGIMVVPLLSGSGMRVKIIEGMMLSKAIITTSVGIEGIEHKKDENIVIADKEQEFANKLSTLILDPNYRKNIEINAHSNAINHYSEKLITEKLKSFILEILK